ncbi:MAG: lysine--tRNA ligase [Candidatus Nealsonbacteria bacterium CG09_land_8_20_14_0_10_42_14]|uniref:Lysine--tRNA ligase n=1 Tax=Candidatus Nealsonbacteria bacterium CG09_land_8_20_14_0_10_42_14 TaxID=1974707 RepID=A0A2H0WXG1_9BACT|nr:MAG: lysine--tRNA ligase [Candidatus Nealsonbacteria bacterium CG09_land_8_20_14_0_10_42_14]
MALVNIRKTRIKKLEAIKKAGINPYPIKTKRTHSIEETLANFERFARAKTELNLVGRIRSIREHGGSAFFHFEDGTNKLQAYLKRDKVGAKKYQFFLANFDVGDFIEVAGTLFKTKRGEKTIEVSDFRILAKSVLPLPEKWHGLQDVEERFRKRYLDLIMNSEVKEKFQLRSRIIEELRNILAKEGFLEVETPILQPIPGGALAKPFKTHLNALKLDLYLRVSPELYLKRLLVGGFEKIYEIGRCFRNEGMDKHHNPDFTMLELYWAYQDRDNLMNFLERIMVDLVKKIKGKSQISYQGQKIDFKTPWRRIKYQRNYEETREKIIQPTFVIDYPVELSILAKAKIDNHKEAHSFQLVIGGIELIKGFSELNDPIEQERRFQKAKIETERKDKDFLEALQYGMPPAAGLGLGVDRLVALLTDSHSLREAIIFPTMRPK